MSLLSSPPPHSSSQSSLTEIKGCLSNDFSIYQSNPIPVAKSSPCLPAQFTQLSTETPKPKAAYNTGNTTCGAPGTTGGRKDVNMAPQWIQRHTGNDFGSRAVTREQDDNVSCLPQWLAQPARQPFRLVSPDCLGRVRLGWGGSEKPRHWCSPSTSVSYYYHSHISSLEAAPPSSFVDNPQKKTIIQKHLRLLISVLTMHHLYLPGVTGWER